MFLDTRKARPAYNPLTRSWQGEILKVIDNMFALSS